VEKYGALVAGVSCGFGYLGTRFIPTIPYFDVKQHEALEGLWWSFGIMVVVLILFGYVETCAVAGWIGKKTSRLGIEVHVRWYCGCCCCGSFGGTYPCHQWGASLSFPCDLC
jgi:hypothetical protein